MKNFQWIGLTGLVLSLCITGAVQAQQQQALIVGIVDMGSVLKEHPVMTQQLPQLQQQSQADMLALQKINQDCSKQVAELRDQFKIGSAEFEEHVRPIRERARNAEIDLQEKQQKMEAQLNQLKYAVFKDIQAAVQQVALQKGILIVHARLSMDRTNVSEEVAAVQEADANTVVWSRPECDITNDVKAVMLKQTSAGNSALNNITSQVAPTAQQQAQQQVQQPQQQPQQQMNTAPRTAQATKSARR